MWRRSQGVIRSAMGRFGRVAAAALLCGALLPAAGCSSKRPPAQRLPMELLKNDRKRRREVKTTATIVGVVLGPDGTPLDFAMVSAVNVKDDPEGGSPPLVTTSLQRGKFELKDVPPGRYGLTVTAPIANAVRGPGFTGEEPVPAGSFAGIVTAQAGETGPPILIRLRPQTVVLRGQVQDEKGAPLGGALVRAVRESPFEGDHFFARTDGGGRFFLGLPEGRYFVVGELDGRRPTRLDVSESNIRSDLVIRLPPALIPPTREEVASWVSETGGVITSADANDTADLAKLRPLVGEARLVGFGAASYTGGEMMKLKLRMLRYLVEEMGFSALFVEAGQADVRALDEHVRTGKGNLRELLPGLGYFSLDTEEMAGTIAWMRLYNEDRRRRTKLRIFGVDVQRTGTAARNLEVYLTKVDKAFELSVDTTLSRLRNDEHGNELRKRPAVEQEPVLADVESIAHRLEKNRRVYIAKTSWSEYTQAVEDAAALVWALKVIRDDRQRAAAMADVTARALAGLPKGTRAALWSHSTQVSRRTADGGLGAILGGSLGKDYVALGFTFYQGWIRAWDFTAGPTLDHGTKLFRLPPAEVGSLEAMLETAGAPMFFADVRRAPGPILPWLEARLPMRSAGTVFVSDRMARTRTVVKEAFDGLVFIRKLTTVKQTETGKRPGQREWE
jgi:erythromycin esterase